MVAMLRAVGNKMTNVSCRCCNAGSNGEDRSREKRFWVREAMRELQDGDEDPAKRLWVVSWK